MKPPLQIRIQVEVQPSEHHQAEGDGKNSCGRHMDGKRRVEVKKAENGRIFQGHARRDLDQAEGYGEKEEETMEFPCCHCQFSELHIMIAVSLPV